MQFKAILYSLLISGASIAAARPFSHPEARELSISARDADLINEIVAIAVREVLEARGSAMSSLIGKGKKKEEKLPSYKQVGRDRPPGWTQGDHGVHEFHSEWDPHQSNYEHNHKSPSHTQSGSGHHGGCRKLMYGICIWKINGYHEGVKHPRHAGTTDPEKRPTLLEVPELPARAYGRE
ncbi:hypothetical protein B0H34DRAFT_809843 [Crassisporium funariophilum]|nr:hypothetical protein B0H34DRAFT_809843 [Crassisporium funariophilum]